MEATSNREQRSNKGRWACGGRAEDQGREAEERRGERNKFAVS